jgi:hypothetical protein
MFEARELHHKWFPSQYRSATAMTRDEVARPFHTTVPANERLRVGVSGDSLSEKLIWFMHRAPDCLIAIISGTIGAGTR